MNLLDIIRTANSNLFRNKLRSLLTIIAIFVGSFTIILNNGINYGVNSYVDTQVANAGGQGYLEVIKTDHELGVNIQMGPSGPTEFDPDATPIFQRITQDDLETLRGVEGVQRAIGLPMVSARYIQSYENNKRFELSLQAFPSDRLNVDMISGRMVNNNRNALEIALAPDFAEALGYTDESVLGRQVRLGIRLQQLGDTTSAPEIIRHIDVTVVGVQNRSVVGMGANFINLTTANAIQDLMLSEIPEAFRPADDFMFAIVEVDEDATDEEIAVIQELLREKGFQAMTIAEQVGMVMSIFDAITTILNVFGAIALLAASIGIVNTLFMAVQERTKEIGLMKAMGLSSSKIFLMFSSEAIMLGFWGSVVGIIAASIARVVGNNIANNTFLADLPGFTLIEFSVPSTLSIVFLIMFIAFVAGTLPARRAARQNPIDALRYE
ncbi:FtsX-like permease family protein [Candidatus Saccharibacteria bacterium]|nr:FtsX-like permease family protein [Candidatus Saccharibacteria bacterium]